MKEGIAYATSEIETREGQPREKKGRTAYTKPRLGRSRKKLYRKTLKEKCISFATLVKSLKR